MRIHAREPTRFPATAARAGCGRSRRALSFIQPTPAAPAVLYAPRAAKITGGNSLNHDQVDFTRPPRNPLRRFCLWLLGLFGWRTVIAPLPGPKGVVIVYPHTSNWDFVIGMLYRLGHGVPVHWLGKHSLFKRPFAGLLKKLGGIPVDRRSPKGVIRSIAEEFRRHDFMWLALAPEGTRSHTDHLKSGFYNIALAADVPCGLGYIDYGRRVLGIDTFVRFTGNLEDDLETVRAFYADKRGLRPDQAGDIRFRPPPQSPDLPKSDSS